MNVKVHKGFEQALLQVLKEDGFINSQTITALRNESFSHI